MMIPVWPVATNFDAQPRSFALRSSSNAAVILPILQSLPTNRIVRLPGRWAAPVAGPEGGRVALSRVHPGEAFTRNQDAGRRSVSFAAKGSDMMLPRIAMVVAACALTGVSVALIQRE